MDDGCDVIILSPRRATLLPGRTADRGLALRTEILERITSSFRPTRGRNMLYNSATSTSTSVDLDHGKIIRFKIRFIPGDCSISSMRRQQKLAYTVSAASPQSSNSRT